MKERNDDHVLAAYYKGIHDGCMQIAAILEARGEALAIRAAYTYPNYMEESIKALGPEGVEIAGDLVMNWNDDNLMLCNPQREPKL